MHNEFSLEGKTVDSPIISQQLVVCHVGIALLKLKRRKKYLHTKMKFYSNSVATFQPGEGGGGDSAYERGGDARCLAWGCKFWILVSLRVFWAKRHHI